MRLGEKVQTSSQLKQGAPPVVLTAQPDSYVVINSPEALKGWEADVRERLGLKMQHSSLAGSGTESCSGGCSDDCDMC